MTPASGTAPMSMPCLLYTSDINLKQWRSYGTKTAKVEQPSTDTGKQTETVEKERDASTAPSAKTYTVKKGDTLWAISAKY